MGAKSAVYGCTVLPVSLPGWRLRRGRAQVRGGRRRLTECSHVVHRAESASVRGLRARSAAATVTKHHSLRSSLTQHRYQSISAGIVCVQEGRADILKDGPCTKETCVKFPTFKSG